MKLTDSFRKLMGRRSSVLPILLLAAAVSGCAVKASPVGTDEGNGAAVEALLEKVAKDPGAGAFIKGVPFYPQKRYMCGPSAIRSVLNYYGLQMEEAEAVEAVYSENIKGALMMDLLILAKSKGFDARFYSGSIADLKARLRMGAPLLLLIDTGLRWLPMGHYIVAVGYDEAAEGLIAHSGEAGHKSMPFKSFVKAWRKAGYSTLLVTPASIKE